MPFDPNDHAAVLAAFNAPPAFAPPETPVVGADNYDAAQGVLEGLKTGSVSPEDAQKSLYWLANGRTKKQDDATAAVAAGGGIGLPEAPPIVPGAPSGPVAIAGVQPNTQAIPEQTIPFKPTGTPAAAKGAANPDAAARELDRMSKGVAAMSGMDASQTPGFRTFGLVGAASAAKGGVPDAALGVPGGDEKSDPNDPWAKRKAIQAEIQRSAKGATMAESTGAAQKAAEWADLNRRLEEEDAGWKKTQARYMGEADRMMQEANAIREDVKKSEMDKRSYLERNPFSGIALAIGAAIGGALSARTGGPNQGLQTLERAIDRDIELQKYNIEKKRGDLAAVDNLLARNMRVFGDMQTAHAMTRLQMKEAAMVRIKGIEETTNSQVLKENANLLGATLAKGVNDEEIQVGIMNQRQAMMLAAAAHGASQSGEGQMFDLSERFPDKIELGPSGDGKTNLAIAIPKGANPDEVKKRYNAATGALDNVRALKDLTAKLRDTPARNLAQKAALAQQVRGKLADISQQKVSAEGGDAAAEFELQNVAKAYGNPDDWFDFTGGKWQTMLQAIDRAERNVYSHATGMPVIVYGYSHDGKLMGRVAGVFQGQQAKPTVNFTEKK